MCFPLVPHDLNNNDTTYAATGDWYSYASSAPTNITTAAQLAYILTRSVSGTYYIMNDIDMSAHYLQTRPSIFSATLYGNGYTIKGITIQNLVGNYAGFVNELTGSIYDLVLKDLSISVTGYNQHIYVGGIAALNMGTIRGCYVSGSIFSTLTKTTSAHYDSFSGGIASYNANVVRDCMVNGSVIKQFGGGSSYSYQRLHNAYVGGIIGYSLATSSSVNALISSNNTIYSDAVHAYVGGVFGHVNSTTSIISYNNYVTASPAYSSADEDYIYYSWTISRTGQFWGGWSYKISLRVQNTWNKYDGRAGSIAASYNSLATSYSYYCSGSQKDGYYRSVYTYTMNKEEYPIMSVESYLYNNGNPHGGYVSTSKSNYDWLYSKVTGYGYTSSSSYPHTYSTSLQNNGNNSYPTTLVGTFTSSYWICTNYINNGHPILKWLYWQGMN